MKQPLYRADLVASGSEACDVQVVPNGKKVQVISFRGEAAFSTNSAVKLVWDFNGAGETTLWSIKGSSEIGPDVAEDFPVMTGDGVKKIAVCLDNNEAGSVFMSAHAILEIED